MSDAVRILHVFPYYCAPDGTDSGGGTKTALLTILRGLDPARYESLIVLPAPSHRYDPPLLAAGGHNLIYLNDPNHLVLEFPRLRTFPYLPVYGFRTLRNVARIARIIVRDKVDLIHTHGTGFLGAAIAGKLCGVPVVLHVHEHPFKFAPWLRSTYLRLMPLLSDHILCCADFIRQALVGGGCPPQRVQTVYNAIDLSLYSSRGAPVLRSELRLPSDTRLIGFVGRLSPRKGVEYYLEAARALAAVRNDVVFVVVGDNDVPSEQEYKKSLFAKVENAGLGGRVHFLGTRADMKDVYSSLDILVFSSPTDMGPFVPLEAMAMGVPVVTASEGGAEEEVEHGVTGVHVRSRDVPGIVEAVLALLADPGKLTQMGHAGRRRVESLFDQERCVKAVTEVYEGLLERRRTGMRHSRQRSKLAVRESDVIHPR